MLQFRLSRRAERLSWRLGAAHNHRLLGLTFIIIDPGCTGLLAKWSSRKDGGFIGASRGDYAVGGSSEVRILNPLDLRPE